MAVSKINSTFFLIFGQGINFLFNLLMLPFLVRQLPLDTYATYSQVLLITMTLYPIISLGIGNGMIAFFNADKKHNFNVVLNGLISIFIFSVFSYFLLFFCSDLLENQMKNDLIWDFLSFFFFSVVFQITNDLLFNYLVFIQESKIGSLFLVVNNVFRLGAIYLAIFFNLDLFYIFLFQIFALVIGVCFYLIYILKIIKRIRFVWELLLIKKLIKLSIPLSLTSIVGVLLIQTDGFIISSQLGRVNYAYYRTGAIEIPFLSTIYGSISIIFLPEFKKLINNKEWVNIIELKRKLILNSALLVYPIIILILFFGRELLILYLGEAFMPSVSIFLIYNLVLFIRINDYSDILILKEKTKFIAFSYIIIFIYNLIFGLISVYYFGLIGPVFVTFTSILLIAIFQLIKTVKILNTNILYLTNFTKLVTILILDSLMIFIVYFVIKSFIVSKYIVITSSSIIFLLIHYYTIYKIDIIDYSIKNKLNQVLRKVWV
jgi:PST family polysaccharide transporter